MRETFTDLDRWQREGEEIALATLVRVHGSAPRPAGARLFVTRSGRMTGSISGGCVDNDVFEQALRVLEAGRPALASYGIADELDLGVGLSCGGSIDVLAGGRVDKHYNLWSRNPVTVTAQQLATNSVPGKGGYDGPSY